MQHAYRVELQKRMAVKYPRGALHHVLRVQLLVMLRAASKLDSQS